MHGKKKVIVAITGGRGFIGRRLALAHLAQGDTVRILSRQNPEPARLSDAVEWHHGDLTRLAELQTFADGADILYHCAGEIRDESRMKAVHVDGTGLLIHAARGRIARWVQLSSVGAYGTQRDGVITEQAALKPAGVYEVTKAESDALVEAAITDGAFEGVILRPSNVYGADMPNQSLFGLIAMIRRGWFFYIGPSGASANYIHVENVVEALMRCGCAPHVSGRVFNLSDHRTIEQFVAIMAVALGCPTPNVRLPESPVRLTARLLGRFRGFPLTEARVDALTGRAVYSNDKIERELGYRHVVSMEEGLKELADAWQQGGTR